MTNSTVDITQPFDRPQKLLRIIDNGDGTYSLSTAGGLGVPIHDSIELSYTGDNLTGVVYKLGTTTVSTLTLVYTGSRLDTVTKT